MMHVGFFVGVAVVFLLVGFLPAYAVCLSGCVLVSLETA